MIEPASLVWRKTNAIRRKEGEKKVRAQNNFKNSTQKSSPCASVPGYSSSEYPGNEVAALNEIVGEKWRCWEEPWSRLVLYLWHMQDIQQFSVSIPVQIQKTLPHMERLFAKV